MAVLPRLDPKSTLDPQVRQFLADLRRAGFAGDVGDDYATRLSAATDNSIYQVLPAAVLFPRHTEDVVRVMRLLDRHRAVSITARGGGTGTNGQSLTTGVVLDLSRHMARIGPLVKGTVIVQPGVVLDDLNAWLAPHGVFFAPNLSPSNRATLGGMIATDASGEGSRVYGKTAEHVLELEMVLPGGLLHRAQPVEGDALDTLCSSPDPIGSMYRLMREVAVSRQSDIAGTFPRLQRYMTGYNLAHMASADGQRVDLTRLICGSEGSLVIVTEARLRVTPVTRHAALFVLHYASFDEALASAGWLLQTDPGSIETVDETVLGLARQDVVFDPVRQFISAAARAINLVEYRDDDEAVVTARVEKLRALLADRSSPQSHSVTWEEPEIDALWNLRKKGVGLLGNAPGPRKPVPFVEDTVVPPEHLYAYVREFRALLDAAGLRYGMFGHVDVGCLHVRPALDLKDPADEALVRKITNEVTTLVTRYGGLLWGEHGKGFRSEFVPHHFGPVLYREMQRIKAAFDPHNQLNPGKIATAGDYPLISIDGPTRGARDRQIGTADRDAMAAVISCNGNGQCFDTSGDSVMCPSSKITRDRIHSPKGRATMMREWLRLLAGHQMSATEALRQSADLPGWQQLWERLVHGRRSADFSHQVYDAMAGCLACKACATQCPVRVDIPEFRAQFLELYHRRYARPLGDYFTAMLERMLPYMALAPRMVNLLMGSPLGRGFARCIGLVDAPLLDPIIARRRLFGIPISDVAALRKLDPKAPVVVVLQDAFTTFYEPEVLEASCRLLQILGYQPQVFPYFENGKALHIKGFLRPFRRLVQRNSALLRSVAELGFPLVGIEPAVVLTYRDEYRQMLEQDPGFKVWLLQEWLATQPLTAKAAPGQRYRLFSHCTEQTLVTRSPRLWAQVFERLGVPLDLVKTGCCGMCGIYGLEASHRQESLGIFDLSWGRHASDNHMLATGFSCRHQVQRARGFTPLHPSQALLNALR